MNFLINLIKIMSRKEEILLNEPEIVETKPSKVAIAISIIVSTLLVTAVTTLLVGHFKFDWFKSDNYKLDANINRSVYQANYFSEKKTINVRFSYETGDIEQKQILVDSNFAVFLTEKKDNLNTAALVVLSETATHEQKVYELTQLNLFDEGQIKQLETDPDGSKYPVAVFTFTDDGTIKDIKLPNNMDDYHAESIPQVIEKVIPKLTRNRKEDMSNGLDIKTKRSQNKRTIVQTESPKTYEDFKGSKYSRSVKTEIEDDQITSIESNDNLYLQSEPEEDEIVFGPKDFTFDMKSDITSNEVRFEEKESIELVNKIAQKFTLIDSKELLKSLKEKDKEEDVEEEIYSEESKPLRNLGFPI